MRTYRLNPNQRYKYLVTSQKRIQKLFHFTDAANLESIKQNGLMSAASLMAKSLPAVMNSDELSWKLDKSKGLENYVRLSFNRFNPMQSVAAKRTSQLVMLEIKLHVVSRPFSDWNATRADAVCSNNPGIVHFDVVKARGQYAVPEDLSG